jgi:hypothetical protein
MPKVNVLVEGQTEETFIREVMSPYVMRRYGSSYVNPIIVQTKRVNSGGVWRGGITKYRQFRENAMRLAGDGGAIMLTSLIDLYHLCDDFPNYEASRGLPFRERVRALEDGMKDDINYDFFLPYISTHEFEALVLVRPEILTDVLGESADKVQSFAQKIRTYASPEHINGTDGPARRIITEFPSYDKVRHGPVATTKIGLTDIRAACEHFNEWLSKIEAALQVATET